jgi:hypothetical protein
VKTFTRIGGYLLPGTPFVGGIISSSALPAIFSFVVRRIFVDSTAFVHKPNWIGKQIPSLRSFQVFEYVVEAIRRCVYF